MALLLLAAGHEGQAALHLDGEGAELIDREEGVVAGKGRQDAMHLRHLGRVVWVLRSQHRSRLAPFVPGSCRDLPDDVRAHRTILRM